MKMLFVRTPCSSVLGMKFPSYPMSIGLLSAYVKRYLNGFNLDIDFLDGELLKLNFDDSKGLIKRLNNRILNTLSGGSERYSRAVSDWEKCHTTDSSLWEMFADLILERNPDIVGIQCYTMHMTSVKILCRILKERKKDVTIVLGGAHIILRAEETMHQIPEIDYCVYKNEPAALTEVIRSENTGKKTFEKIKGIYYRSNGNIVSTAVQSIDNNLICKKPRSSKLDDMPFAERFLEDPAKYNDFQHIFTSMGCPWKCAFCSAPEIQGGRVFNRSMENVMDELAALKGRGFRFIRITDDTFTASKKRVVKFVELLKANKLMDLHFSFGARGDTIDEELLDIINDLNIASITIGVESGSARILQIMNKRADLKKTVRAFEMLSNRGIETKAFFMVGNPTETVEDVELSYNFASLIKASTIQVAIAAPLPSTQYEDFAKEKGISFDIDTYYKLTSVNAHHHNISDISTKVLEQLYSKFQKKSSQISARYRIKKGLKYLLTDPAYVLRAARR